MSKRPFRCLALLVLLTLPMSGCATIAGTVVSPITGGVDLAREYGSSRRWYMAPVYFIGGAIADASVFSNFSSYWHGFDSVFQPFRMIR